MKNFNRILIEIIIDRVAKRHACLKM